MSELLSFVCVSLAFLFGIRPTDCSQHLTAVDQNDLNLSNNHSDVDLEKLLPFTCLSNGTLDCLKSGITRMMARLESRTPLEIVPGLSLSWDLPAAHQLTSLDVFNFDTLVKAVNTYLGSISLKIQLLDEAVLSKGARSLEQIFSADNNVEGRKRKDQSGLLGLAMAMKASMLSMVMAGVAAMSGKALMVSMMALAFAALSALKGSGEKSTTYEIKHEPAHHGHYKRSLDEQHHYEANAFNAYKKDTE